MMSEPCFIFKLADTKSNTNEGYHGAPETINATSK